MLVQVTAKNVRDGFLGHGVLLLQHPFYSLFSRTIWVSRYQKNTTVLDLNEANDNVMAVASAGPYSNYLHFTPDMPVPHHSIF